MGRSVKKGPFIDEHLMKKVQTEIKKGTKNPAARMPTCRPEIDNTWTVPVTR